MCPAKCTLPTKFCLVEYDVTNPSCNLRNHVVSEAGTDHHASHRGSRVQVPVNRLIGMRWYKRNTRRQTLLSSPMAGK